MGTWELIRIGRSTPLASHLGFFCGRSLKVHRETKRWLFMQIEISCKQWDAQGPYCFSFGFWRGVVFCFLWCVPIMPRDGLRENISQSRSQCNYGLVAEESKRKQEDCRGDEEFRTWGRY
jgi:hypothetical protein